MPSATFTVSSGSERVVEVYPDRRGASSGSASIHSPTSSGGRSFSSTSTDSWSQVEAEDEDGIDPSDSASRSRQPTSRRYTTEARPAPTRRHSSRRVVLEREEESPPPRIRRRDSHRHHSSRHRRAESRRTPSDESGSVAYSSPDDYPPSHHGAPYPPSAYPPRSGYRHVPAPSHGGYPPGVSTSAPYMDPFAAQALVHMPPQHDPFGYGGQPNPFSSQYPAQNPLSPMSSVGGGSYFGADPHAPPSHVSHRPPGPPRPQSYAAPSHYGSEVAISPYPYSQHPSMSPYGYPPPTHWPYPPSHSSSPAPPAPDPEKEKLAAEMEALKATIQGKDEAEKAKKSEEVEAMKALLKKYEEAQAAREKAEAAAKAEAEAEKKKKEEIAAAQKKAKEDAEKKAEEALKKAKEEHEKKLAEAKKAQEELEKKHKELEEEAAKHKPSPDSEKAPIRFKDAVNRKFSFPWHICKTWKGMEGLIRQAFAHVDLLGEHVMLGHYDLTGPDGEIILPQVWDTMIQPDWEVSMHMWPLPEEKPEKKSKHEEDMFADPLSMFGDLGMVNIDAGGGKKGKKGKDGKKKGKSSSSPEIISVPPAPPHGGPMGPPPDFMPGGLPDPLAGFSGITIVDDKKRPKARTSSRSKDISPFAAWIAGGKVRSKR